MSFSALKTHEVLHDLHDLETELSRIEQKYGMPSDAVYSEYMQGEEPDDDSRVFDFAEWAGIYRFGPDVDVLEPEELRLAVRVRILAAAQKYF